MRGTVHLLRDTADITRKLTKYFTALKIRRHFPLVLMEKAGYREGKAREIKHTKPEEVEIFELQPRREVESFSPSL